MSDNIPSDPIYDGAGNRFFEEGQGILWVGPSGQVRQRFGMYTFDRGLSVLCGVATRLLPRVREYFGDDHILTWLYEIASILCSLLLGVGPAVARGADDSTFATRKQQILVDLQQFIDEKGGAS